MISKFRKVNDDLYRGSAPSVKDIAFLKKHFGIKKIVSLDEASGKKIDRVCKLLGIEHIMLPIDINRRLTFIKFLSKDIVKLLEDGPTYIHCLHGIDRTSLAIALYRVKHDNWTADAAIKEAKTFGFGNEMSPKITQLYETIIRKSQKSKDDSNSAYDIVSNEREDSILSNDNNTPLSFAPYLDGTVREYPYSPQYQDYQEQYTNRQDFGLDTVVEDSDTKKPTIPQVGGYDTISTGIAGCAPSFIGSGYI